jgi:FkbM family methyltransferase
LVAAVVFLTITKQLETQRADELASQLPCPKCSERRPFFAKLFKPVEFEVDFYGMSYYGNSGNYIDNHVLFMGAYEKDVLHLMRDLIEKRKDGVFLDIGANTGQHSLFMSKHSTTVHAVEPYEPVLNRLRAAIERNGITNIKTYPVGFGEKEARLPFERPPDSNLGTGSFLKEFRPGNTPAEELQIVVGDEALADAGVTQVDVIKVDVEGYEKPVLRGLRRTLEASRPIVVMELTIDKAKPELFQHADELRATFPKDYSFLRVIQDRRGALTGVYHLEPYDFDFDIHTQRMIVAFPAEQTASLGLDIGVEGQSPR